MDKCCLKCEYIRFNEKFPQTSLFYKCQKLNHVNLEQYSAMILSCKYFEEKKVKKKIKLYAYIPNGCFNETYKGELYFLTYNSPNKGVIDRIRVPSEDREIEIEE